MRVPSRLTWLCLVLGALAVVGALALAALPPAAAAAPSASLGTPTPPVPPTDEPTAPPTPQPTAPPTDVPPADVPPTAPPTLPPVVATVPPHKPRKPKPTPTPEPTTTPAPTATPEPWRTNVSIMKVVDRATVQPGDVVRYTLMAQNTGSRTAYDVVVSDQVPADVAVTDLQSAQGTIVVDGQTVTAYIKTLEPGQMVVATITGRVRASTPPGDYRNTAMITTSTEGDDPGDNTSSVVITVAAPPATPAPPARLPETGSREDVAVLAAIPPLAWLGITGTLLLVLGAVVSMTFLRRRGGAAVTRTGSTTTAMGNGGSTPAFRLPPSPSAGPPALGQALPPPAPPAPLPPLALLDRADAMRDVLPEA